MGSLALLPRFTACSRDSQWSRIEIQSKITRIKVIVCPIIVQRIRVCLCIGSVGRQLFLPACLYYKLTLRSVVPRSAICGGSNCCRKPKLLGGRLILASKR